MLSAAKHPVAGWGSRMTAMCIAAAGLAMAVLAFLPWFDFPSVFPWPEGFSRSGVDLPGLGGEAFLVFSLAIIVVGFIAVRSPGPMPLLVTLYSGIVAFAVSAQQVLTHWQAGSCFAAMPRDDYICGFETGGDFFIGASASGSPAPALWIATGLSAFVALLAAWRLFARPPQSNPEAPLDISEAWA